MDKIPKNSKAIHSGRMEPCMVLRNFLRILGMKRALKIL